MPTDFSNIKTTIGREYREKDIKQINDSLYYLPDKQRASVLASIIEESGGDPLAKSKSGTYQGLLQWGPDRYRIQSTDRRKELQNQLQYLKSTILNTTDKKSWTHGGAGSGFNSFVGPFTKFHSTDLPLDSVYRGFSYGYVRPEGKEESYQNRLKVAKQVLDRFPKVPDYLSTPGAFDKVRHETMNLPDVKAEGGPIEIQKHKLWHELSQAEKSEMMRVAVKNGITNLQEIRQKYNEFAEGGNIYDGTTMNSQQMQTAIPDATYVNTPIAPIYSPAYQLPEVTVRPDSNLSPAARVLAEKARQQAHDRAFGKGSYNAYRRQEQTDYLIDKVTRPTNADKALDYAQSLFSGIGQGADIASMTMGGLPVYSALKGAKSLSEKDYVDGAMWMTPMLGIAGKKAYDAGKHIINNYLDLSALKTFNSKYGYTYIKPKTSIIFNDKKLDKLFDYTVNRHNTFVRGVDPYEAHQNGRLLHLTPEEAAKFSLTHIPKVYEGNNAGLRSGENGLYLSNSFETAAGYTNDGKGFIGIVRRPIQYGQRTRRDFLRDNDFVFSRPPGKERPYFTTTDEPNYPWIHRHYKGTDRSKKIKDSKPVDWTKQQNFEVRANAGARIIEPNKDSNYRHYIIVGNEGEQPVELLSMFKPLFKGSKAHTNNSSISLSRKKNFGGTI